MLIPSIRAPQGFCLTAWHFLKTARDGFEPMSLPCEECFRPLNYRLYLCPRLDDPALSINSSVRNSRSLLTHDLITERDHLTIGIKHPLDLVTETSPSDPPFLLFLQAFSKLVAGVGIEPTYMAYEAIECTSSTLPAVNGGNVTARLL